MDAAPMTAPGMLSGERTQFLHVNGLRLLCREWGAETAEPLVLLHGLRGFSGTWRTVSAALQGQYRLVAFDQRGRGESDWDPACNYYTDAYVADLEAVVAQLGLARFSLLGHSMGGTTAYVYAGRHPEQLTSLVIEDIVPGSSSQGAGAQRILSEMAELPESFGSWDEARAYWRARRPSVGEQALEQRLSESLRELPSGRLGWRFDAQGIRKTRLHPDPTRSVDLWPILDHIRVPTLIIHGADSDFCREATVTEVCRRNPLIRSISIAGASHYVHDDRPELFISVLRNFLATTQNRKPGATAHG